MKNIGITKHEIENQVDDLNNNDDILKINEEIKKIINHLTEISKEELNLNLGIKESDVDKNEEEEDDFLLSLETNSEKSNNIDNIDPVSIIKIFYILHKQKRLIPPKLSETIKLINYFSIKKEDLNDYNEKDITINNIDLNNKIIDALKIFYNEFKSSESYLVKFKIYQMKFKKLLNI